MKNQIIVFGKTNAWGISSRSALIHSAFARALGLTMILAMALLTTLPEVSRAQTCPTGILPAGCSWSAGMPITEDISLGGDPNDCAQPPPPGYPKNCCFQITYCLACCNGVAYATLESFQPGNFMCDNVDPETMYNYAITYISGQAARACGVPPCGQPALVVSVSTPTCWTRSNPSGSDVYGPCYNDCSCTTTCDVCTDSNNNLVYSNCTSVTHDGTGNPCTPACAPDPGANNWLAGTCYVLPCPIP